MSRTTFRSQVLGEECSPLSRLFRLPRGKGTGSPDREQSSALRATLRLIPGAGVTPAEGSVKPTAVFTFGDDRIGAYSLLHPCPRLCTVGGDSPLWLSLRNRLLNLR